MYMNLMQNTNPNVNIGFLPDFQDFRKKKKKKNKNRYPLLVILLIGNHPSAIEKWMVLKIEYIHFEFDSV